MEDITVSDTGFILRFRERTVRINYRYDGKRTRWNVYFLVDGNYVKGYDLSFTPKQKETLDVLIKVLTTKL
jgi:hypothetical protein